jgi:hypothetical protein
LEFPLWKQHQRRHATACTCLATFLGTWEIASNAQTANWHGNRIVMYLLWESPHFVLWCVFTNSTIGSKNISTTMTTRVMLCSHY